MATLDELKSKFIEISGFGDSIVYIDGDFLVFRAGDVGSVGVAAKDMDLPIDVFSARYIRPAVFALKRSANLLPEVGQQGNAFKPL